MKLALVHDWLTGMRGGEKCLEVLCRRFPEAELLTLLHARGRTSPTIEQMRIRTSPLQRVPGAARHYRYLLPLMPWAVERLSIPEDVDAVVSFSHAVAKSIEPPPGVPHICYCFTPMRYAWHLREAYLGGEDREPWPVRAARAPLKHLQGALLNRVRDWDCRTSDRVTHYVAISRTVADRIDECYERDATIIYPPVDTRFFTPADVPREGFYLCVSALVPYKRIDLAIRACALLGRRLIIIGEGPQRRRLERMAAENVQFQGWQSGETIRDTLRRCSALLFPGIEDFGIVPLEAAACGTPVIALGQGGATETVLAASPQQPGTGWFFDAQTPESLAAAMLRSERERHGFDACLARGQAERFGTARFETELVALIERVVADRAAAGRADGAAEWVG